MKIQEFLSKRKDTRELELSLRKLILYSPETELSYIIEKAIPYLEKESTRKTIDKRSYIQDISYWFDGLKYRTFTSAEEIKNEIIHKIENDIEYLISVDCGESLYISDELEVYRNEKVLEEEITFKQRLIQIEQWREIITEMQKELDDDVYEQELLELKRKHNKL